MNYQPVTKGNQTNPSAGFQDKFNAEKAGEEIDQQYVHFPVWSSGSTNPQNNDGDAAFDGKGPNFDAKKPKFEVNVSPSSRHRDLSAEFEDFSDNNINEVNAAGTIVPTVELEDITYSDDENDVGAEADFNNLETFITCVCTRSSSNLPVESPPNPSTSNPKRRNRRRSKQPFILKESLVDTMVDQRTMAELLRAPTEGYAEAIVFPSILDEKFELKHSLINMMTSDQFFGLEKDVPHDHIRWFNKITSTIKYKDVPNSTIKLMLFPFSLVGAARRWLEKEPPHSILTWEDLVSKFINEFFPPSRTTNLRNEISNFQKWFDESFHEARDRYKDLIHACPHHGFIELHQLDTFYNALNPADQDSLNFAAGGNLLERRTQNVLTIIKNKSKVRNSRNKSVVSQVKSSDANSNSSSEIAKLTHAVNQQTSAVTTAMTAILK
nr:reverse transcriptase domain-containing protein [Tanacetum cinerariifolium]